LKFFVYRYSLISILSFLISNLLYNFFLIKFHESFASLFSLFLILNLNIFFFFKLKIFKTNKINYLKISLISIGFRTFEYLLFNLLFLYILTEVKSNYIFAFTLILSFAIKSVIFYKTSDIKP
jgi:hypothetical protein